MFKVAILQKRAINAQIDKNKITIPSFLAEELKEYCSHLYGIMTNERMFSREISMCNSFYLSYE